MPESPLAERKTKDIELFRRLHAHCPEEIDSYTDCDRWEQFARACSRIYLESLRYRMSPQWNRPRKLSAERAVADRRTSYQSHRRTAAVESRLRNNEPMYPLKLMRSC